MESAIMEANRRLSGKFEIKLTTFRTVSGNAIFTVRNTTTGYIQQFETTGPDHFRMFVDVLEQAWNRHN